MIGPIVNVAALFSGSVIGALIGPRLSTNVRQNMPLVFGCASMGLGVAMIGKVVYLAPVVLALVVGALIGEILHIERAIQNAALKTRGVVGKITKPPADVSREEFMDKFVALLVLFSMSGTGIYGAMSEGMSGDPTLLFVKSILDLFTAVIFAASMGYIIAILIVPQFIVQAILYLSASQIMPLINPSMLADFSACGGLIMLATGFRICGIKPFAVANMLPALFLVMPLSWAWALYM